MLLGYTITHIHVHVHTSNYICIVQMYCTYLCLNLTQSIINCYMYMYPYCIHCMCYINLIAHPPPLLRIHVFQFFPLFNYYYSTLYVYSQTCTCNIMIHRFRRSCSWLWINGSWGTGTGLGTE